MILYFWLLLALGTLVQGDRIFVKEPAPGRSIAAGSSLRITWGIDENASPEEQVDNVQLDVLTGPSENGSYVIHIVGGLSPSSGAYDWSIPSDFPTSNSYFVRVTGFVAGGGSTYAFSGRWGVRDGGPPLAMQTDGPPVTATMALTSTRVLSTSTRLSTITSGSSTIVMTRIQVGSASQQAPLATLALAVLILAAAL